MWPWCKINDEELEAVAGGVTHELTIRQILDTPVPVKPQPGETAQMIFIFFP